MLDRVGTNKKDSLGRARDTKVLGLISMVTTSCGCLLCETTLANANKVDKTLVSEEAWSSVEELMGEVEQRLAGDANWFWSIHSAELLPAEEKPATLDAMALTPEQLFAAFCSETVGIRRSFLWEHYAAFTGSDLASWFAARTNCGDAVVASVFVDGGWIVCESDGGEKKLDDTFDIWTLTGKGLSVWDSGHRFYEENRGSKQLQSVEQFVSKSDASDSELLEECTKNLAGAYSSEVLKLMTGAQLCIMLMKRAEIPLDVAAVVAGQLVACGYMLRLEEAKEGERVLSYRGTYGLAEVLRPHCLNGRRAPVGPQDGRSALEFAVVCYTQIRDSWNMLRQSSLQNVALANLPMWKRFCEMVIELQKVNLDTLSDASSQIAFWVNVHNTLFLHAWITHRDVFTPPESALVRACYLVSNCEMTLQNMRNVVAGGAAPDDVRIKWEVGLQGSNVLAKLLFSNNYRVNLGVATSGQALEEEIARQATEDLANVELEENNVLRVSRVLSRVVDRIPDPLDFVRVVLPYLAPTWQGIVQKALDNKAVLTVKFVAEEPETLAWGSISEEAAVGGGMSKDLWAEGVLKKHSEARAIVASIKGESQMLQTEFDLAQEQQQQLKAQNEAQEEQAKALEQAMKKVKEDYEALLSEAAEKRSLVAEAKAKALRSVSAARDVQKSIAAFLQGELSVAVPELDALFERALNAPLVAAALSGTASGAVSNGPTDDREFLKTRDPLSVASADTAPFKWIEQQHHKWLKDKCKHFVPNLPGDDAFLAAVTRVHSELLEDASQLDRFAEKGLVESYARFFSTWKERINVLLTKVLVSGSDTPAIVAANGWFNAENVLVGVLRYRKQHAVAKEKLDRLYESIGIDAGTLALAAEFPELMGLASKPGRFLLMRGKLPCKRVSDAAERELDVILLSDILIVNGEERGLRIHKLEQCVALEAQDATQLEVFDSGAGTRLIVHLPSVDLRDLWLRRLSFACTLTKSKLRKTKGAETTLRRQQTADDTFDTDTIKAEIERKRASVRAPLTAAGISGAGDETKSDQPETLVMSAVGTGKEKRRSPFGGVSGHRPTMSLDSHDFKFDPEKMKGGK